MSYKKFSGIVEIDGRRFEVFVRESEIAIIGDVFTSIYKIREKIDGEIREFQLSDLDFKIASLISQAIPKTLTREKK